MNVRPNGLPKVNLIINDLTMGSWVDRVRVNLSNLTFVRPALLALLCANLEMRLKGNRRRGIEPASRIELVQPKAKNVKAYLKSMNLIGALTTNSLDAIRTDPEDRFHPLCRLTSATQVEAVAGKIKDIVLAELPPADANQQIGTALAITLAELLENFSCHAQAESSGFACAQYYAEREYRDSSETRRFRAGAIEVAVADTGIGIAGSLRQDPAHRAALEGGVNVCEYASELGVTSKPGPHSGLGLWVARRLLQLNGGILVIVSEGKYFRVRNGKTGCGPTPTWWPGTFVGMRLRLDGSLDLNRVYNELGPLE